MATIAIVDYGMGNLHSVRRALEHVAPKHAVCVTQSAEVLKSAERVVFPGQGAIGMCMHELERFNLIDVVRDASLEKPFLGICLGPQALMDFSEEDGGVNGLGIFPGSVKRFPDDLRDALTGERLKIPHMGWNQVQQTVAHPLWEGIPQAARFYFVHSYYLQPADGALVAGSCDYGLDFAAALARSNVFAVQFHPEKSAAQGLRLLQNFVAWDPSTANPV